MLAILASGRRMTPAAGLRAQVAQPSYAGFEGQNVSKVALSAPAKMELDRFRSLVKQKEGAAFSSAAIGESVAALQKTACSPKCRWRSPRKRRDCG